MRDGNPTFITPAIGHPSTRYPQIDALLAAAQHKDIARALFSATLPVGDVLMNRA